MRTFFCALAALAFLTGSSLAQVGPSASLPIGPGPSGGGGGGGGSGVSSFSTTCPPSGPSTGAVTFTNNLPWTAETGAFTVSCGVAYDATVTAPAIVTIPVTSGLVSYVQNDINSTAALVLTPASGVIDQNWTVEYLAPGQFAQLTANGTNVSTDIKEVPCSVGYVSGIYTTGCNAFGSAGSVVGANSVTCEAFKVSRPGGVFKALGGYVTTTDTTGTGFASFALYTNGPNFRPGSLIDFVAPLALPGTSNNPASGSLANTTDTLGPSLYWACISTPSSTVVFTGIALYASPMTGGATTLGTAVNASNTGATGFQCTAGNTGCGTAWSGSTFTWPANFTTTPPTWTQRGAGATPNLALQVN